jgi:hypothetical protein
LNQHPKIKVNIYLAAIGEKLDDQL